MTGADLCRTNEGVWPLPGDLRRAVPPRGEPGSFLEDRGDRRHCGVDIYAPQGSQVVSISDGLVFDAGVFTEPGEVPYWKKTFYVVVQGDGGLFVKYAELEVVDVRAGEPIRSGERLGRVGSVPRPGEDRRPRPRLHKKATGGGEGLDAPPGALSFPPRALGSIQGRKLVWDRRARGAHRPHPATRRHINEMMSSQVGYKGGGSMERLWISGEVPYPQSNRTSPNRAKPSE
ncbi:MAG: hypothetical protein METHAR1v1_1660006 [Methanothrix sp.]|nr:MAG: hypothetical protein METHAR1v1_1660006 [Methanothrix sp.]